MVYKKPVLGNFAKLFRKHWTCSFSKNLYIACAFRYCEIFQRLEWWRNFSMFADFFWCLQIQESHSLTNEVTIFQREISGAISTLYHVWILRFADGAIDIHLDAWGIASGWQCWSYVASVRKIMTEAIAHHILLIIFIHIFFNFWVCQDIQCDLHNNGSFCLIHLGNSLVILVNCWWI